MRPVIASLAGPDPTAAELAALEALHCVGVILFGRNIQAPGQVQHLIRRLRAALGPDLAVLIDQEGGRVQRLKPPHWPQRPPAAALAAASDPVRACHEAGAAIGRDLADLGITVNCAPSADLLWPGADGVIGDRAFGQDPEVVARLARAFAAGLMSQGVLPVVKHLPGHGRARVDSHKALPRLCDPLEDLAATDWRPFQALADLPLAMTAHLVLEALDPDRPATCSPRVIAEVIRGRIGFQGVLMSDDLGMAALSGPVEARAQAALEAGCDLVLHCSGEIEETLALTAALPCLDNTEAMRISAAFSKNMALAGLPLSC